MNADSFHQPDGRFPILRTGSQHADDSMRSEYWRNSKVPVKDIRALCITADLEAAWLLVVVVLLLLSLLHEDVSNRLHGGLQRIWENAILLLVWGVFPIRAPR